jgi:hypothetical protein
LNCSKRIVTHTTVHESKKSIPNTGDEKTAEVANVENLRNPSQNTHNYK